MRTVFAAALLAVSSQAIELSAELAQGPSQWFDEIIELDDHASNTIS